MSFNALSEKGSLLPVLERGALEAAPALLGCLLIHETPYGRTSGRIVETEAYRSDDPASHSFKGHTPRTDPMFLGAGHAYVYFTYGMHWCLNVVAGKEGDGQAVLIRALEPVEGQALMRANRHLENDKNLTTGPARLTQALGVTKSENGVWLGSGRLRLEGTPYTGAFNQGPRIGISKAANNPWRFWLNSPFVSK